MLIEGTRNSYLADVDRQAHNPTYKNRLEILDSVDDKLLVRISAECCDINFYDGSIGNDVLEFTAWIEKRK